jgi:transcriptional regulator with XRE-family HTH domain
MIAASFDSVQCAQIETAASAKQKRSVMTVGPNDRTPSTSPESPTLAITCGGGDPPYTVLPADGPVTIGRDLPSQIRVNDQRISRTHLRIEPIGSGWTIIDLASTNGTYLDGEKISSAAVTDGMVVRLGNAAGIAVTFGLKGAVSAAAPGPTTSFSRPIPADEIDDEDEQTAEITDPAIARVGAAVAARREELGYSQRNLSDDKIISQSNLVAFERGRSWPREATREKLERYLKWPPGTLARIRHGAGVPQGDTEGESTEALSDTVQVSILVEAVGLALEGIKARAATLALPEDPAFSTQVGQLLDELRRLQTTTANAARRATGTGVALLLSDVRRTYNELMLRAARAPGATLGARFYAARRGTELTIEEAAAAAGLNSQAVADAEAGRPLPADTAAALEALIAQLGHR